MCRISISRFYRDHDVFETLRADILPRLAQYVRVHHEGQLRCWSAGCASGEEVYTLKILWHLCLSPQFPDVQLDLMATDIDPHLLDRARRGQYGWGSVKDLPSHWIEAGFDRFDTSYKVRETFRDAIHFVEQDIRQALPDGPFHLILCRNLVFTYFADSLQRTLLAGMATRLVPGGILLVGKHESLPQPNCMWWPMPHGRDSSRK
jgi:chemotaxis protein methyltransferase CheR